MAAKTNDIPWLDNEESWFPWYATTLAQAEFKELLTPMIQDQWYSRDVAELNKSEHHLVFVYGTLMKGKANHHLMSKAKYLCPAWTSLTAFHLYQTSKDTPGRFPVAIVKDVLDKDAKGIGGELYQVDVPTIKRLDKLEANGTMYRRCRMKFRCGERFQGQETYAWMYIGMKECWSQDIKEGLPKCPHFTSKKNPTYSYYTFLTGPVKVKT